MRRRPPLKEVLYLLVERYQMPEPAAVARRLHEDAERNGEEPEGVEAMREGVADASLDLGAATVSGHPDARIRAYLREILRCYDESA